MTNFSGYFSCWHFVADFFYNRWTIFNWYVIRHLNFNFSAHLLGFWMTNLVGNGTERGNTLQMRYFCAMWDFNMTRHFYWDFVAASFDLDLACGSTSYNWKRCVTFSIS